MKELIKRLRKGVADTGVLIKSAASVNATMSEAADALEQQAKQIEELADVLAGKDEALRYLTGHVDPHVKFIAEGAIALQPHASLVAKIKAEGVRDYAKYLNEQGRFNESYLVDGYADRIEREGK